MKITILQGHPDAGERHYCHALADAYAEGATAAGHDVRRVDIGALDFPILRSRRTYAEPLPASLNDAHAAILWADHLVILFPLWLGDMPALVKAFLEQVIRVDLDGKSDKAKPRPWAILAGKSARIVVTMGMPAFVYRWYFFAHTVSNLKRNILGLVGVSPVRETLIGMSEGMSDKTRADWLDTMRDLGRKGV